MSSTKKAVNRTPEANYFDQEAWLQPVRLPAEGFLKLSERINRGLEALERRHGATTDHGTQAGR